MGVGRVTPGPPRYLVSHSCTEVHGQTRVSGRDGVFVVCGVSPGAQTLPTVGPRVRSREYSIPWSPVGPWVGRLRVTEVDTLPG